MRTIRIGKVEIGPAGERVAGHDSERRQTRGKPRRAAEGTPWPPSMPRALAAIAATRANSFEVHEVREHDAYDEDDWFEHDGNEHDLTAPVRRGTLVPMPLPPPDDDVGTRTLMGIGARAVRATAKSGWVEARPATREPRATPDVASSQSRRASIDEAPARTVEVAPDRSVQPLYLPPEESDLALALVASAIAPPASEIPLSASANALAAPPLQHPIAVPDWQADPLVLSRKLPRPARKRAPASYRVLAIGAVAVIATALAAYIATTVFYAFSKSWAMPVVVSQSDDKVVALKSGLAAQQQQRDRLVAELDDAARAILAQKDPKSAVVQQAGAQRKVLQAAIARQDEIIRGLEQSPYLRAITDRATVALVPYDNLEGVGPGTQVVACRAVMVLCREVGRVLEVLPGEVAFKHPRREKMLRGQMLELRLTDRGASAEDVLFLGGAPLLF